MPPFLLALDDPLEAQVGPSLNGLLTATAQQLREVCTACNTVLRALLCSGGHALW